MPSLKEIKERIASVGNTLKITSAMKMVAAAKLRKAQKALGNLGPYQACLSRILSTAATGARAEGGPLNGNLLAALSAPRSEVRSVALVCFASNQSLCGAFNTNVVKLATKVVEEYRLAGVEVSVFPVGRKMADAMRRLGFTSGDDYSSLSARPSYEGAAALGSILTEGYISGRFDRIELVYNHLHSTASQPSVRETYLPLDASAGFAAHDGSDFEPDVIIEPDRDSLIAELLPKVLDLKVYTTLLDASAAEHAARTVAMQMATDNAEELLQALKLEYNKSRQQKITAEILDLVGGAMQ